MKVGDIVVAKPGHCLCCGSGVYSHAIVISVEPFIMVSEKTDMRWSCFSRDNVQVVGKASCWRVWWCKWKRGNG